ncbi:hypothetical protein G5B40_08585 [Pikeienuella piscinae]|uniref:Uncharacterized protein n=1 Tax=Pikeienuella piscinae TaxID=2748098 RepID=A0A7L5BTR0_9RHOB|nr:hypothetical protein [Pikeienuella piscinae]QIE55510.1 hypothetical protein G5B40_08585 [Pikeienuella piscinae]
MADAAGIVGALDGAGDPDRPDIFVEFSRSKPPGRTPWSMLRNARGAGLTAR